MKYRLLIILCVFLCVSSHAALQSFTCPTSYTTVMIGDTMQKVEQACGKPNAVQDSRSIDNTPQPLVKWIYVMPGNDTRKKHWKMPKVTITFQNGQVAQVISNDVNGVQTLKCINPNISLLAATQARVRFLCGMPTYVTTELGKPPVQKQLTIWQYQFNPYDPGVLFVFEFGQLSSIDYARS